eukprot:1337594-Amphidinium_carterae.1
MGAADLDLVGDEAPCTARLERPGEKASLRRPHASGHPKMACFHVCWRCSPAYPSKRQYLGLLQ